jgi:hypothetical protein
LRDLRQTGHFAVESMAAFVFRSSMAHSLQKIWQHCVTTVPPAPHKDFSDLYGKMSGKGASASEAHL